MLAACGDVDIMSLNFINFVSLMVCTHTCRKGIGIMFRSTRLVLHCVFFPIMVDFSCSDLRIPFRRSEMFGSAFMCSYGVVVHKFSRLDKYFSFHYVFTSNLPI